MNLINCNAVNCFHNNDRICYSNKINILGNTSMTDSDTCCGTFLDSITYGSLSNTISNSPDPCTCLACNVETCKYNENQLCSLNSIHISGNNASLCTETNCESFRNK